MKTTLFILGSIETLVGIVLWSLADMLKNIIPLLGWVAYQAAAAGSYSPNNYILNTMLPTTFALVLIVVGVVQILLSMRKEK